MISKLISKLLTNTSPDKNNNPKVMWHLPMKDGDVIVAPSKPKPEQTVKLEREPYAVIEKKYYDIAINALMQIAEEPASNVNWNGRWDRIAAQIALNRLGESNWNDQK